MSLNILFFLFRVIVQLNAKNLQPVQQWTTGESNSQFGTHQVNTSILLRFLSVEYNSNAKERFVSALSKLKNEDEEIYTCNGPTDAPEKIEIFLSMAEKCYRDVKKEIDDIAKRVSRLDLKDDDDEDGKANLVMNWYQELMPHTATKTQKSSIYHFWLCQDSNP